MLIDVVTLFPKQIFDFLNYSIIGRATHEGRVNVAVHDLRKWAVDARGSVDDKPYGGGLGMILRCEPVVAALRELKKGNQGNEGDQGKQKTVMFDARGEVYNQRRAFEFSKLDHLILIAGHYEGFDERILNYVDATISVGEYVLTGGEIPALTVVDSVVRLLPGVLKEGVVENESFSPGKTPPRSQGRCLATSEVKQTGSLSRHLGGENKEHPQYTRPEVFEGHRVPEVLLSGNHGEIEKWRNKPLTIDH